MTRSNTFVQELSSCRICGNTELATVFSLGEQALTGVFPKSADEKVLIGPLELVKCVGNESTCGLVQLGHSYPPEDMYGDNYGYRSGLNPRMIKHLQSKVEEVLKIRPVQKGDLVLDIGSNDGTTLSFVPQYALRIGVDPVGEKFQDYYPNDVVLVPSFFSAEAVQKISNGRRAKVIFSISMMYDLESPIKFAQEVASILDDDGIWVFEQSYMPLMVSRLSFDTICHEHIEYYTIKQIDWMLNAVGLEMTDVQMNDVNGGSFSVTAMHQSRAQKNISDRVRYYRDAENSERLNDLAFILNFGSEVQSWRNSFLKIIHDLKSEGQSIAALGASTKGNVLLQYCEVGPDLIDVIGDVNEDKWGRFTPGTGIPIVSEGEALARGCDVYIVLPWHFRNHFLQEDRYRGKKLLFPLPATEIVSR